MGCKKVNFNLGEIVYMVIVSEDIALAPKFKILRKIETLDGIFYDIDPIANQSDPNELARLEKYKGVRTVCGDSIFRKKFDAVKSAENLYMRFYNRIMALYNLEKK